MDYRKKHDQAIRAMHLAIDTADLITIQQISADPAKPLLERVLIVCEAASQVDRHHCEAVAQSFNPSAGKLAAASNRFLYPILKHNDARPFLEWMEVRNIPIGAIVVTLLIWRSVSTKALQQISKTIVAILNTTRETE